MTPKEWATEFAVINGRQPSPTEFAEAKAQGFPSLMQQSAPVPPVAPTQQSIQTTPVNNTMPISQEAKQLTSLAIVFRVALVLVIAVFGYIVGYLFA